MLQDPDTCSVCLAVLDPRGGVPLINPGCCGNSFHLPCYNQVCALAFPSCPLCRARLGPGAAPIAPLAPVPHYQFRPQQPSSALRISVPSSLDYPAPTANRMVMQQTQLQQLQQVELSMYSQQQLNRQRQLQHQWAQQQQQYRPPSTPDAFLAVANDPLPAILFWANSATPRQQTAPPTLAWNPAFVTLNPTATEITTLLSVQAASYPELVIASPPSLGVDLLVCVDVSGSMSGSPIESVKETLRYITTCLTRNDRIAIIQFNGNATQLTRFHICTPGSTGFATTTRAINAIHADGGTKIVSACQLALEVMNGRDQKNSCCGVLLLSDGQDSGNYDYSGVLGAAEEQHVPFFTYGFGADHDSALLSRISGKSGTFTYIPQISVFQEAFDGCLGGIKSTVYQNFEVSIRVPENALGVRLLSVECSQDLLVQDGVATIKFGDLFAEEQRDIIVKFGLTSSADNRMVVDDVALSPLIRSIGVANYSYKDALSGATVSRTTPAFSMPVVAHDVLNPQPFNSLVTRQILRLLAIKKMKLFVQNSTAPSTHFQALNSTANYERAKEWLETVIKEIKKFIISCYCLDPISGMQINLLDEATVPANIPASDWPFIVAVANDVTQCAKLEERGAAAQRSAMLSTYSNQRATYTSVDPNAAGSTSRLQKYKLFEEETSFLVFDTDVSTTAIWFFEGVAPVDWLADRVKQIVAKNPWLVGRLTQRGIVAVPDVTTGYPTTSDLTSTLFSVVRRNIDPFESHVSVARIVGGSGAMVPSANACLEKSLSLVRFSVFESVFDDDDERRGFSLVVSLNHAIADGATFYKIANMLDESTPIEALAFTRVKEFPVMLKTVVPDSANLTLTLSMKLSMHCTIVSLVLQFLWKKYILGKDCFPTQVFPISPSWIASQKVQSESKRLSSNDIITSHLLRVTNCHYGGMAVNLRGRLPGIDHLLAGNYEAVVLYTRPDFMKPQQIRASISHPSGSLFQRVTQQLQLPNPSTWFVKFGNCTNWAGLYGDHDMQLPGAGKMLRHEPLPVVEEVPMPLSLFIIFAPRKGELAVLTNDGVVKANRNMFQ
ncbi:UNVERIFIED_CONTAM: hypothetical protein HDU68_011937 [Siphonaria sp. JEL0065]|nr:hypothetical protein HDU68_011937 [Siphonaria sp. JEL0065]